MPDREWGVGKDAEQKCGGGIFRKRGCQGTPNMCMVDLGNKWCVEWLDVIVYIP